MNSELPIYCTRDCDVPDQRAEARACALQKQRHEQTLSALYCVAGVLSERSGQGQTLHDIIQVLEQGLGLMRCTIMLLTPDGERLVVAAVRSVSPSKSERVKYDRGEGITGTVLAEGRSVIVPSIAHEPSFRDRLHERSRRRAEDASFICVPITLGREVVGTLAADLPTDDPSSLNEAERTLTIVASMIGFDVRVRRAEREEREALEAENLQLRDALREQFRPENIVGNSRPMREVYLRIRRVAASSTTVLVRGETGTGKELVASAIHYSSPRADGPFVRVNCAQLSESLLESELFGHEKGAFTGAVSDRIGRIEQAEGGTLFLDEIGDFAPAVQVKLLRFLQEHEFERVGSNATRQADVRVIAATNRDLEQAVAAGDFRQDLYYRIHVFPITLPPLRDRGDDTLLLANHFVEKYAKRMSKPIHRISTPAINTMLAYHWPGNVRELENCIEYAVLLADDDVIHSHHLPPTLSLPDPHTTRRPGSLQASVEALERDLISDAIKTHNGNATAAAKQLDLTPRIIRYKMKKLGL